MNILFVVSGNVKQMPFIEEQKLSLEKLGCNIDYFYIHGGGAMGYLSNLRNLRCVLMRNKYDLIHAHYGLSGLLSSLQSRVPVIITFHGSDIYKKGNRYLSLLASRLSRFSIFVNKKMPNMIFKHNNMAIIPCGVDGRIFYPMDKKKSRKLMGMEERKKYALFSSSFTNKVKNAELAKSALSQMTEKVELVELRGRSRNEVNILLNACDLLLITSFHEGSPQIVKEALFCGTPIVSTKVGDVPDLLRNVRGCYLADSNPSDIADKIGKVISKEHYKVTYHDKERLDIDKISNEILKIYQEIT